MKNPAFAFVHAVFALVSFVLLALVVHSDPVRPAWLFWWNLGLVCWNTFFAFWFSARREHFA